MAKIKRDGGEHASQRSKAGGASAGEFKLPGLYPWLRFEGCLQDEWVERYGINLEQIDRKAADVYLEGEADFFEDEDSVGMNLPATVKQHTLQDLRDEFAHAAVNLCERPIEQMMLAALFWLGYGYRSAPVEIWDPTMPFEMPKAEVVIAPQYQIGEHRVDFAVFIKLLVPEVIKIVVECDHDLHENTNEQAADDKRQDRNLQIAGWKVLRFSSSEVLRDWYACAAQVDLLAANEIDAQLERLPRQ